MGKHLLLDLKCFNRELMEDKKVITNILNNCVSKINMNKLIEPVVVDGAMHNKGLSAFVIIETSHISIHTFSDRNKVAFDLYSCKDYDENIITEYLMTKFDKSEIINKIVIKRFDEWRRLRWQKLIQKNGTDNII